MRRFFHRRSKLLPKSFRLKKRELMKMREAHSNLHAQYEQEFGDDLEFPERFRPINQEKNGM